MAKAEGAASVAASDAVAVLAAVASVVAKAAGTAVGSGAEDLQEVATARLGSASNRCWPARE